MESVDQLSAQTQEIINMVVNMATLYAVDVAAALVILILGFWVAGKAKNFVNNIPNKSDKVDRTVAAFLASIARYAIIAVTVLAVLERFGFQTASLIALLGAAGLAIGLALQGTLSNIAAGVMLLIFRPFKVGNFVDVSGHMGTIKVISLFTTELDTGDNVRIIIPNSKVWGASIQNYNHHETRRLQIDFGISYDADIDKAMEIVHRVVGADERTLQDPEPLVAVSNLGDSSVDVMLRVWCLGADYWAFRWHLLKTVKQEFDKEGIDIPFPSMTLYKAE